MTKQCEKVTLVLGIVGCSPQLNISVPILLQKSQHPPWATEGFGKCPRFVKDVLLGKMFPVAATSTSSFLNMRLCRILECGVLMYYQSLFSLSHTAAKACLLNNGKGVCSSIFMWAAVGESSCSLLLPCMHVFEISPALPIIHRHCQNVIVPFSI